MRGAILPLLLLAGVATAADLRDLRDPAKIKNLFPRAAKLRVVNVWATWCVPCVYEMPELRTMAASLGPEVAFVGVSADDTIPEADRAKVAAFLDKQKIGYTNVYYRGSVDDLMSYYHLEGEIPITIAFDRAGKEVWRHHGPVHSAEAVAELRQILRRMR
ncbi:MAG TPA: TlpA disulfide reductase family protein [Thermoanaerobaculia bacterium]|nr:TlpA disulfide reductase family protein [Thermoanaerobaculia bacterium]